MATTAKRRLIRDLRSLKGDQHVSVISSPLEDNMFLWKAVIFGPEDTPWEGGTFRLTLEFTNEYPTKPPVVKFVTKIFHPNGTSLHVKRFLFSIFFFYCCLFLLFYLFYFDDLFFLSFFLS